MAYLYFFFCMLTYDEEVYFAHLKIRNWYLEQIKRYRRELPLDIFKIVKKKLDTIIDRANNFHRERDLAALTKLAKEETMFFFLPWEAVIWYSQQKKPKNKN